MYCAFDCYETSLKDTFPSSSDVSETDFSDLAENTNTSLSEAKIKEL